MAAALIEKDKPRSNSPKRKLAFYGAPVGILQVQRSTTEDPFDRFYPPGSVNNASTWTVPVRYKPLLGVGLAQLIDPNDMQAAEVVVQAAIDLEREGSRLITANCGFMIRHQEAVRAAVDIPVLLSPLLLIPLLQAMLPPAKSLGIVTAKLSALTPEFLKESGVSFDPARLAIAGLENAPAFAAAILTASGDMDVAAVEAETVEAAQDLIKERADIGMLMLECSESPPYAAAVQRATGLPVFDFTSLVEFFITGLSRQPYTGFI